MVSVRLFVNPSFNQYTSRPAPRQLYLSIIQSLSHLDTQPASHFPLSQLVSLSRVGQSITRLTVNHITNNDKTVFDTFNLITIICSTNAFEGCVYHISEK